jgi:hypothetical protein
MITKKIFQKNCKINILPKSFSIKSKPDTLASKSIQKILNNKETKYCYINNNIKFNEYGLYLVAEHLSRKPNFLDAINLTILSYFASMNILICLGFLVGFNRESVKDTFFLSHVVDFVTHVYLTRDMDKVVFKYYFPPVHVTYDIRNIELLSSGNFNEYSNGQFAVVLVNGRQVNIPVDIVIHNKEIFSAIFRGFVIKKTDGEINYTKLISNDKVNYIYISKFVFVNFIK